MRAQLKQVREGRGFLLVVERDGEIVGVGTVGRHDLVRGHTAELGISLAKEARGSGIGRIFLGALLDTAWKHIAGLRQIQLGVFGTNAVAIRLYESFGFRECGRVPHGVRHRGRYVDEVCMYLERKDAK